MENVGIDWSAVDRHLMTAATQLRRAVSSEDFQAVGLFCRESLISLSQAVFDSSRHQSKDGVQPSPTDSKRMLDAFFSSELSGGSNEEARRHARASVSLADALVHRRTATYRDAALCLEATQSTANLVFIINGRSEADRVLPADVEPFRIPQLGDPVSKSIVDQYKQQGFDTVLPRVEERDVRLASGHGLAYYPGTRREVWVGYHGERYEHILMTRPKSGGA
jgi:hypothetical protein